MYISTGTGKGNCCPNQQPQQQQLQQQQHSHHLPQETISVVNLSQLNPSQPYVNQQHNAMPRSGQPGNFQQQQQQYRPIIPSQFTQSFVQRAMMPTQIYHAPAPPPGSYHPHQGYHPSHMAPHGAYLIPTTGFMQPNFPNIPPYNVIAQNQAPVYRHQSISTTLSAVDNSRTKKPRQFAIPIIHPDTKEDIMEHINVGSSSTLPLVRVETTKISTSSTTPTPQPTPSPTPQASTSIVGEETDPETESCEPRIETSKTLSSEQLEHNICLQTIKNLNFETAVREHEQINKVDHQMQTDQIKQDKVTHSVKEDNRDDGKFIPVITISQIMHVQSDGILIKKHDDLLQILTEKPPPNKKHDDYLQILTEKKPSPTIHVATEPMPQRLRFKLKFEKQQQINLMANQIQDTTAIEAISSSSEAQKTNVDNTKILLYSDILKVKQENAAKPIISNEIKPIANAHSDSVPRKSKKQKKHRRNNRNCIQDGNDYNQNEPSSSNKNHNPFKNDRVVMAECEPAARTTNKNKFNKSRKNSQHERSTSQSTHVMSPSREEQDRNLSKAKTTNVISSTTHEHEKSTDVISPTRGEHERSSSKSKSTNVVSPTHKKSTNVVSPTREEQQNSSSKSETSNVICTKNEHESSTNVMEQHPTIIDIVENETVLMQTAGIETEIAVEDIAIEKSQPPKPDEIKKYTMKYLKEMQNHPLSNMLPTFSPRKMILMKSILIPPNMSATVNNRRRAKKSFVESKKPDIIHVRLSLHEDIQLNESTNAWKPNILKSSTESQVVKDDSTILAKKVLGILNRLTPENFDVLLEDAINFRIDNVESIKQIMMVLFEKAIAEPNFSPQYARFCAILFKDNRQNQQSNVAFISVLLKHTQEEFESNVNNVNAINSKLQPIIAKIAECLDSTEKENLKIDLETEEFLFRRRALGTVRLIGELFNLNILNGSIINGCLKTLLDHNCEEKLEYLCKLLTTVGKRFERCPIEKDDLNNCYNIELNKIMSKMQEIVNRRTNSKNVISNRVRFMLQDVIDLRLRNWNVNAPKVAATTTFSPMENEKNERKFNNYNNKKLENNQCDSDKERKKKSQQVDVAKLPINLNMTMKLGNIRQFTWNTRCYNSNEVNKVNLPAADQENPLPKTTGTIDSRLSESLPEPEYAEILRKLVDTVIDGSYSDCVRIWSTVNQKYHNKLILYLLSEYIFLREVKQLEKDICSEILIYLIQQKLLTFKDLISGYKQFSFIVNDLIIDVPNLWRDIFYILGPLIVQDIIKFDLVWNKSWLSTDMSPKFVKGFIEYFTTEYGPNYMRSIWKKFDLKWTMFFEQNRIPVLLKKYQYNFIGKQNFPIPVFIEKDIHDVLLRVKRMLKDDKPMDTIFDYIAGNVKHFNTIFISTLTSTLCDFAVINDKLNVELFAINCVPLLRRYIDGNEEFETKCINTIEAFVKDLECPPDLIASILCEISHNELISKDTIVKWSRTRMPVAALDDEINAVLKMY